MASDAALLKTWGPVHRTVWMQWFATAVPHGWCKWGAHLPSVSTGPIDHWNYRRMASATPAPRLPSQPQGITAPWPVPNCTAWWQVCEQLAQGCYLKATRPQGRFWAKQFGGLASPLSFIPLFFLPPSSILFPFPPLRSRPPYMQLGSLWRSPSGNRILCILALKSDIWWHQIY